MFFTPQGTILNHAETTVIGEYYAHVIETNLLKDIRRKQLDPLRRQCILHQDNTTVHMAKIVQDTLTNLNTETYTHPIPQTWPLVISDCV